MLLLDSAKEKYGGGGASKIPKFSDCHGAKIFQLPSRHATFWKNRCMKNIQDFSPYKKVYIDFLCRTPTFPQNGCILAQMVFPNFFNIN